MLRQDSESQGSLAPVPGLADLDSLLAEVAKAGLAVRLRVEGTPSPLPAGVDLSAYRIVQEALTNVVKHAGPARAQVTIRYRDQDVPVEVTDDGRAHGGARGRRPRRDWSRPDRHAERVAAFGGDLETGPRPGGRGSGWPLGCLWRRSGDEHPGDRRDQVRSGPGSGCWSTPPQPAPGLLVNHHRTRWPGGGVTSVDGRGGRLWCTGVVAWGGCGGCSVAVASGHE